VPALTARTDVDPARRNQWLFPSAARVVRPADVRTLLPIDPAVRWEQGDLLLAQVLAPIGRIERVENVNRCEGLAFHDAELHPGSVVVVVLAPRAGTHTCIAEVPKQATELLDLHGGGGQAGLIVPGSQHTSLYRGPATRVRVLARLGDAEGRALNTRSFGEPGDATPRAPKPDDPQLVLVVGSDMDSGKTTTARRIIYSLRAMGAPVVAGKAVGVGELAELCTMFDAGASEVFDFSALGEPVTIDLPRKRVLELFFRVFHRLRAAAGKGGFVVIELADGIWYPETRYVLEDEAVRRSVAHIVFACEGVLDAEHGLAKLERWGYAGKIRAVSGRVAGSGLLRAHLPEILGGRYPLFDALDYDALPETVASLFTGT
jgi:hypothetical protein